MQCRRPLSVTQIGEPPTGKSGKSTGYKSSQFRQGPTNEPVSLSREHLSRTVSL